MSLATGSSDLNIVNNYCKYLNRKVTVKTTKTSHTGSLKCIDPLTQTIALVVNDSTAKTSKLVIVMSHSITSIQVVDDIDLSDDITYDLSQFLSSTLSEQNKEKLSEEELLSRKDNVMKWLHKSRIPCEELDDGSLCIAYALTLSPPYTRDQCVCANERVLHQIQTLLDSIALDG